MADGSKQRHPKEGRDFSLSKKKITIKFVKTRVNWHSERGRPLIKKKSYDDEMGRKRLGEGEARSQKRMVALSAEGIYHLNGGLGVENYSRGKKERLSERGPKL